jgi:hypothetical protein
MPLLKGFRMEFPRFIPTSKENNMTTTDRIARRKLSLLELAQELGAPDDEDARGHG